MSAYDLETPGPTTFPDGGYGWICVAASATINAHTWGINSSYGVFLAEYLSTTTFPGATPLQYAFVGSLSIACCFLISPIATLLAREIGPKRTMFCGVALHATSLLLASLARTILQLFITQGVLFGIGMGILFSPVAAIVPQWFSKRRSLATSLSAAGAGIGGLIYSIAAGTMIQRLGVPWTLRSFGIIAFFVNLACICLLRDRNSAINSTQLAFDTKLLRRLEFILLLAFSCFSMLGYVVLIFSLANYANYIGLDASQAALVSALFNLGQGLGRPLIGYFSDHTGRLNMAVLTTCMAGVVSFAI